MRTPISELLEYIDPKTLDYNDWLSVGMAIKHEGGSVDQWEIWSLDDPARHHLGECTKKWNSFHGSGSPVTGGTLIELARRGGWEPGYDETDTGRVMLPMDSTGAYGWGDEDGDKDWRIVDPTWTQEAEVESVKEPGWRQLQLYIEALFEATDYVGYVCEAWEKDGRFLPKKGIWTRTAGELLAQLERYKDIGAAFGDPHVEAGAWIRFNPLDGKGINNENVSSYRYTLVECDDIPIENQAAIFKELELPIAALVHSGKRSLHAIVKIEAANYDEYRKRVDFLFNVLRKNGIEKKAQANKNPNRLSRMPGVLRNGVEQSLVGLAQGRTSWEDWKEWVEELNDSLPDIEPLEAVWADLPPLAPPLIDGLLRQGHKMLLSGPSKAGKSYLLLQLVMAIAEGKEWLGWPCTQGRVLYVNLELDRPSCLQRLKALYDARGWAPEGLRNIDIWNLRGKAVPMDKLAPKLIRRALRQNYAAVIIDPIYKVITGDENAADKMAYFCNQFDKLCSELGSAVIYCHHHSKGAQGQKTARDRSSGSGVFARDPDAILDLLELTMEKGHREVLENRRVCAVIARCLDHYDPDWAEHIGEDTAVVAKQFLEAGTGRLQAGPRALLLEAVERARLQTGYISGWRLEATLREYPPFEPRNLLFTYPTHVEDKDGLLKDAKADGEDPPWRVPDDVRKERKAKKAESRIEAIDSAYRAVSFDNPVVRTADLATHMGVTRRTVLDRIKEHPSLEADKNGIVTWKPAS